MGIVYDGRGRDDGIGRKNEKKGALDLVQSAFFQPLVLPASVFF